MYAFEEATKILDNSFYLYELTDCSCKFLALLMMRKVISAAEVDALISIPAKIERASKFYRIIITRKAAYEHLLYALLETGQSGPVEILKDETASGRKEEILREHRAALCENLLRNCGVSVNPHSHVSFGVKPPTTLFTGREKELAELHNIVSSATLAGGVTVITQFTSVSGLGGVGKTQLARRYVQEKGLHFDHNLIWIDAETDDTLCRSFRSLASDKLGIPTKNVDHEEKSMDVVVSDCYSFFANSKVLFVFDNAESGDLVKRYLPPTTNKNVRVLMTSRNREWGVAVKVVHLDVFSESEAIQFVLSGLEISENNSVEIKMLVEKLACFPLAMQGAVAYIRNQRLTRKYLLCDYLAELDKGEDNLLDYGFLHDLRNDYTKTTFNTWQITVEKISQNPVCGDAVVEILEVIAYFEPDGILRETLTRLGKFTENQVRLAVQLLVEYCMLDANEDQSILSVHRLVQHVIRLRIRRRRGGISFADILRGHSNETLTLEKALNMLFPTDLHSINIAHAVSVWRYAKEFRLLIRRFPTRPREIICILANLKRFDEVRRFVADALPALERVLGKYSHVVTLFRVEIADIYLQNHDYEGTLHILHSACAKNMQGFYNKFSVFSIIATHKCGRALFAQGKTDIGYKMCRQACQDVDFFYHSIACIFRIGYWSAMSMILLLVCRHGWNLKLLPYCVLFKYICYHLNCMDKVTSDTPYLSILIQTADMACGVGELEMAQTLLTRLFALTHAAIAKGRMDYPVFAGIGKILPFLKSGNDIKEWCEVLKDCLKFAGLSDAEVVLHALATCKRIRKEYESGLQFALHLRAVRVNRQDLAGGDNVDTILSHNLVAWFQLSLGETDQALAIHKACHHKLLQKLGANNLVTLYVLRDVGVALSRKSRHVEALSAFIRIFQAFKTQSYDKDTMDFLQIRFGYAEALANSGCRQQALTVLNEIKATLAKKFNISQPLYADCEAAVRWVQEALYSQIISLRWPLMLSRRDKHRFFPMIIRTSWNCGSKSLCTHLATKTGEVSVV